MTENGIHFLDSDLFFSFIVVVGFSRGKGRQDYILNAFDKLAFCLISFCLCISPTLIIEIRTFQYCQKRLNISKIKVKLRRQNPLY